MNEPTTALSVSIDGTPDLPGKVVAALYRTTGRSTVELRRAIAVASGHPPAESTCHHDPSDGCGADHIMRFTQKSIV